MTHLPRLQEVRRDAYATYSCRPDARCWLYEVWDDQNRLAYVGIADDFDRRWRQHVSKSWWLNEINVATVYVIGYQSRSEAKQLEAAVIHEQHPVYNTAPESASYARYKLNQDRIDELGDQYMSPVKKRYFQGRRDDAVVQSGRWILVPPEDAAAL